MEEKTPINKDEPILDEVLFSFGLLGSFLRFMSQDMAQENVVFLKEVQLFRAMRRPPEELHREACRIFFTYVYEGALRAVNLGSFTIDAIKKALWSSSKNITQSLFNDADAEIRNLIMPKFREWLALKEYSRIPFDRLRPPLFERVIRNPELAASLCEFIKKQNSDSLIFEQFKTTDGTAEEHPPAETIDDLDLSLRSCDELYNMLLFCADAAKLIDATEKKKPISEDDAHHLWNQYRKKVPIKHIKGTRYNSFVVQWFNGLVSEFSDSTVYGDWLDQRSWVSLGTYEFRPNQTLDEHGYQVFPTLAAVIVNKPMCTALQCIFGESEMTKSIRFLHDSFKFVEKFSKALVSDKNPAASEALMKQMGTEAKEIFYNYFATDPVSEANIVVSNELGDTADAIMGETTSPVKVARRRSSAGKKTGIPLEKKLRDDVKSNLFRRFRKGCSYDIFTRSAAYVYRHCDNSWFRDLQFSYFWTCMDYDNNNVEARGIEALVDPSVIRDFQDPTPPIMDDILSCPELRINYLRYAFKTESEYATFDAFFEESQAALNTLTPDKMASEAHRLIDMIALLGLEPFAAGPVRLVCDSLKGCKDLNPGILKYVRSIVFESALSILYSKWAKGGAYRQFEWTRVSDKTRTETSIITTLLSSFFLESSRPAIECTNLYGRTLIAGVQVQLQKSRSQLRLVDSAGNASNTLSNRSSLQSSPTNPPVSEPGYSHGDSSANSSSSGSNNGTLASDVPPLVGIPFPENITPNDSPQLSTIGKRAKNPIAEAQEIINTPHPRCSDIQSAYLPRIPTLDETMDSILLRKIFEEYYLLPRLLDETERELWKNLRDYAACFANLSDEDVTNQQPELRARALEILDKYPSYLTKQPFLKSRIASNCFVTVRFFREEEKFLYGKSHQSYESVLEKSGWVRV